MTIDKFSILKYVGIFLIGAGISFFFARQPAKIVKEVTEEKKSEVIKQDNVQTEKTITTKKKDGTVIVEVDKTIDKSKTDTKTDDKSISITTITNRNNWTLGVNYQIETNSITNFTTSFSEPSLSNVNITVGRRIFDLPLFVTGGVNLGLQNINIGVMIEL